MERVLLDRRAIFFKSRALGPGIVVFIEFNIKRSVAELVEVLFELLHHALWCDVCIESVEVEPGLDFDVAGDHLVEGEVALPVVVFKELDEVERVFDDVVPTTDVV